MMLMLLAAGLVAPPLVVDAQPGHAIVLTTASATASVGARNVDVTVVAAPQVAGRVGRLLVPYAVRARWRRIAPRSHQRSGGPRDRSLLDPRDVQFILSVDRPRSEGFAAFIDRLETRLVSSRTGAQVWSIVPGVDDCAALDAHAFEAARENGRRVARLLAAPANLRVESALASADATNARADTPVARRCDLGLAVPPARRTNFSALTNSDARARANARAAVAFVTLASAAGSSDDAPGDGEADLPPRVLANQAATRLRIDADRLGPTLSVIGTSARLRRPTLVRYAWTRESGPPDSASTLAALRAAQRRLHALGLPPGAIVSRVRSGPTFPVNLFVDVPLDRGPDAESVMRAIAGTSAPIASAVTETFVRDDCDRPDARDARMAYASARTRAATAAQSAGGRLGAPLGLALLAQRAFPCSAANSYDRGIARATLIAGPVAPKRVAAYASLAATFSLTSLQRDAGPESPSRLAPPTAFLRSTAARELPPVDVTTRATTIVSDGYGTVETAADRASLDLTIAPDRAHAFAPVDARRAYALLAPLERSDGRAPTRVVLRPQGDGRGRSLAFHLELRGVPSGADLTRVRDLVARAGALGMARAQYAVWAPRGTGEAAALRAALASARRAARAEAAARGVRAGEIVAVIAGAPFVDRVSRAPRVAVSLRVRVIVRTHPK